MFLKACSASSGAGIELAWTPVAGRAEGVLVSPARAITAMAEARATIRADPAFIIDPSFMDCFSADTLAFSRAIFDHSGPRRKAHTSWTYLQLLSIVISLSRPVDNAHPVVETPVRAPR